MKKVILVSVLAAVGLPTFAMAQGDKNIRLAKLEEIVVTADKAQPAGYKLDAKTAALLAEISKSK